jgi:hypothetical protein
MKCAVCGADYGMNHNCAGPLAIVLPPVVVEEAVPPAARFLALHYLIEAVRIPIWNGDAIQRVAQDRSALPYGIAVWVVANSIPIIFIPEFYSVGHPAGMQQLLMSLIPLLAVSAIFSMIQVGLCFLVAKWFMGAEGRFIEVLRPLLLGSIVYVFVAIPFVGIFIAAIAWICVFAMVFQVVADVEAFSAYILSIVIGVGSRILESKLASLLN